VQENGISKDTTTTNAKQGVDWVWSLLLNTIDWLNKGTSIAMCGNTRNYKLTK
jgi:hypothetical protein